MGCVTPNYRPNFGRPSRFAYLPKVLTAIACLAIGTASVAMTVGAFARQSEAASPATRIDRAFLTLNAGTAADAATSRSRPQGDCSAIAFSFLNSATCAKPQKKRVARKAHRIATFVSGNPAASGAAE